MVSCPLPRALERLLCHAAISCCLIAASAFGQNHNPNAEASAAAPKNADPAVVAAGHAQFKSSCGFCHGEDATGSRAPDLVRSFTVTHDEQGSLLIPTIRNGRPDKGMPPFPNLTDAQLASITGFLHHQAYEAAHSAHVPGNYPAAKLLTGSAEEGKKFFTGEGGCGGCHSIKGDLAGVATRLSPIDLQQALVYPSGHHTVEAAVTTKEGQTYSGAIVHRDEFRIGLMCQDGWYRSFDAPDVQIVLHDPLEAHRKLMNRYTDADMHNLFAYLETLK